MRVHGFHVTASPLMEGYTRLAARVAYESGVPEEELWFDVPDSCAAELSTSGDPWLACLLPLAMVRPEPLRIERPVDPRLLKNLRDLAQVWQAWYPELRAPRLEVDPLDPGALPGPTRTAEFFSGGVDSFATAIRNCGAAPRSGHALDDLLYIWGFDLTLDQPQAFARTRRGLEDIAGAMGLSLIVMATNLRSTLAGRTVAWGPLHHGAALASAALVLERRWRWVLIASSLAYADLSPLGSHALTNTLLSSSRTRFIIDSSDLGRVAKTALLGGSPQARRYLHVCWRSNSDANCCRCSKCYRTMATLDVLGTLDQFTSFDPRSYERRKLGWVYAAPDSRDFLREIGVLALERGRPEVARAMGASVRRSVWADAMQRWLDRLKPYRGQGRLSNLAYRWFLGKMIY